MNSSLPPPLSLNPVIIPIIHNRSSRVTSSAADEAELTDEDLDRLLDQVTLPLATPLRSTGRP
jgi:hypothetical protein